MKRLLLVAILALAAQSAGAACFTGAVCGPATRYEVTVRSVALCADASCSNPVTIGSSAQAFDIASAAVGSAIGSYANMDNVVAGTYSHLQTVISSTFTIAGGAVGACPALPATSLSIPNNNALLDTAMSALGVTWADAPTKTQLKIVQQLPSPLSISRAATLPAIAVKFGTANSLMCLSGVPLPAPPDVSLSLQ